MGSRGIGGLVFAASRLAMVASVALVLIISGVLIRICAMDIVDVANAPAISSENPFQASHCIAGRFVTSLTCRLTGKQDNLWPESGEIVVGMKKRTPEARSPMDRLIPFLGWVAALPSVHCCTYTLCYSWIPLV